jgi:tRNA uridine 5-carboxymethylaminomethyl modification enzyme
MDYDIIVVGGGHAGIEAAYIASKKQIKVLLITNNLDFIGQMSCNPAIGGIAKGTLVREVDALGGIMGKLIDHTGIHFKMLNTSKGVAVWGNRAQADKVAYRIVARKLLEEQGTISLLQGMVQNIIVKGCSVIGVTMDSGEQIKAKCVILAMGTFLDGLIHIGLNAFPAGRSGEPPSLNFSKNITDNGITKGRLKTGTSPRIDGLSINYEKLTAQPGDENPWPFSFSTNKLPENRTVCWIGKSNHETHAIIKDNLDRSPMYTGKIKSIGPRYCPSIEDKVVRFGERDGHTLFLEPESLENHELYLNGLSTSLPFDVQLKMVHSVKGLEKAKIIRPGYGIEYSFFHPTQLKSTLESKIIDNLYFAGQINGTSGYEEAACQGIVAGINATQRICCGEELVLTRQNSYTGVLIDDLVTRGTEEPYRMFTSRAEHRLLLRQDNCDERLLPIAFRLGFIDKVFYENRKRIWDERSTSIEKLKKMKISPEDWDKISEEKITRPVRAIDLLKRPTVHLEQILRCCEKSFLESREQRIAIEADIKYSGFLANQEAEIERLQKYDSMLIPQDIEYEKIKGLLSESRQKLSSKRPKTLGQASRISGITPADISILALYIIKKDKLKQIVSRETTPSFQNRKTI